MKRRGFTLIELLVVIAIIAILAAILFPVFASAKRRAQQAACLNNMTQLSKAMLIYTDDYQGSLPLEFYEGGWGNWNITWRERLQKGYVRSKKVFLCSVKNEVYDGRVFSPYSHYGMNPYLFHYSGIRAPVNQGEYLMICPVSTIEVPTKTILIAENNNGDWDVKPWNNDGSGIGSGGFRPYHGDKSNPGGIFVMCDMHAQFMPVIRTEQTVGTITWYYWKRVKRNT